MACMGAVIQRDGSIYPIPNSGSVRFKVLAHNGYKSLFFFFFIFSLPEEA